MNMNGGEEKQFFGDQDSTADFSSTQRAPEHEQNSDLAEIKWTASEFIEHQKGFNWFLGLAGACVLLAVVVYLFTKDVFGPVIIGLLAIIFGVSAARKPKVLEYSLDGTGIMVGNHHSAYEEFRSFSLVNEGAIESVMLLPTKRWSPPLSVYFAPEDADKIVDMLSAFVPFENHEPGLVDRFLHRIHF